ncbi:hypothetical protein M8J76_008620 [Diaphorina citri]|nr:hypothetical protein M8J76_010066 [Diaphorina citri]KAI5724108.1 hypothetical protein M8J76_015466 [Diaphorina citri]KAI5725861.1 hypothetical protein M8J77_020970 [Diaphorina citri]KAI5727782.1 hypothetical protein M8J77_006864 [Diaphorina citri]KAI5733180.1 hypothetical protein M8J76_008620 [Diaphorina citri]
MICSKCEEALIEEDRLTCSVCKKNFHSGCVGIMETIFRKMKAKDVWKCLDCKNKKPETRDTSEERAKETKDQTEDKNNKNNPQSSNVSKEEILLRSLFEEYTGKLTSKMNEDFMRVIERLESMKTKIETLETAKAKLEKENNELKKNLEEIKNNHGDRLDFLENRSRISNLEIRNVPETQGEDVVQIVKEIGRAIGLPVPAEGDIQVAHRVDQKNKERGSRPIIVHMASRYMRNKWLTQYKNFNKTGERKRLTAKMINRNLTDTPVYINEHITIQKKILLRDVKDLARQAGFKYVWVKDSYILIKKDDNDRHVKKINSRRELEDFEKELRRQTFTK